MRGMKIFQKIDNFIRQGIMVFYRKIIVTNREKNNGIIVLIMST